MTKGCDEACEKYSNICDFCYFYDFNGTKEGVYTGIGYCRFHKEQKEPEQSCKEFICFNVKEKEEIRRP